jgi:hypothetical protein
LVPVPVGTQATTRADWPHFSQIKDRGNIAVLPTLLIHRASVSSYSGGEIAGARHELAREGADGANDQDRDRSAENFHVDY